MKIVKCWALWSSYRVDVVIPQVKVQVEEVGSSLWKKGKQMKIVRLGQSWLFNETIQKCFSTYLGMFQNILPNHLK